MKLDKKDKFYTIKLSTLNADRLTNLEAGETFEKKQKRSQKKSKLIDYSERKNEVLKNQKFKILIDFDEEYSSSVKSLAVEQNTKVNLTTRYLNGKMLMFIERCCLYQNLTDTGSTSILFVFICELKCFIDERKTRDIISKLMIKSKIFERLDLSDDFWNQFGVQNKKLKKQVGFLKLKV